MFRDQLFFKWICTALCLAFLESCGGGGGGSQTTPTPSSTATNSSSSQLSSSSSQSANSSTISSSSSSSSSSNPNISFTISGMADADALANANIEIIAGSQHFTAVADAQKKYQIQIDVTPINQEVPLLLTATGVNSNKWVKLASLLPSSVSLKTIVGNDGVLDTNEFFGVNITALTTAEYSLAKEKQYSFQTDSDRKSAVIGISGARVMNFASIITLLLNDINYNLPKASATTLDFLLDSNLINSYANTLTDYGTYKTNLLTDSSDAIESDTNQTKSSSSVEGKFLIVTNDLSYLVDLNSDGTGTWQTNQQILNQIRPSDRSGFVNSPLTWVKKGNAIKLSFSTPVSYGKYSDIVQIIRNQTLGVESCTPSSNTSSCTINLNSVLITIIKENDFNKLIKIFLDVDIKNENGLVPTSFLNQARFGTLINRDNFTNLKSQDLPGAEWFTDNYRYIFNNDGSANRLELKSKKLDTINWSIQNNHLVLDNGNSEIWLMYNNEAGYVTTQFDRKFDINVTSNALYQTYLIKRRSITMSNNDWVGRWTGFPINVVNATFDFYDDGHFRDGFETQSKGSWSVLSPTINSGVSNGNWRMIRDVLAVFGNRYYIQTCMGVEQQTFAPVTCFIETLEKDSNFMGINFWETWSTPLFQDLNNDTIWDFYFQHTLYFGLSTGLTQTRQFIKVSNNKLYDRNTNKILELTNSSKQTVDICEYDLFSDCTQGIRHTLQRGVEISIKNGVSHGDLLRPLGASLSSSLTTIPSQTMIPRNKPISLQIAPQSGYKLDSITGCDGVLNVANFDIPARTTDCEISVSFIPQ